MANTIVITGNNTTTFGTALNKNQTDNFFNSGSGNTIIGIGGNINVTGLNTTDPTLPGTDTNTAIVLTTGTHVSPPIDGVKDTFTLDGSNNSLSNTSAITASTIKFTVLGTGGKNSVNVTDATTSKITADIGVTGNAGGNKVTIDNVGAGGTATNTVAIGGSGNTVTLNGEATNSVTFTTAGGNTVSIGSPAIPPGDDDLFGNKSTVTFTGTGNTLSGGDENFTVSGSTGSTAVHLGDGTNVITLGGAGNTVSVWGGNNDINAGGSGAKVSILGLDGHNTATPTDPDGPDDAPVPLSPTDDVTIAGTGDSVTATYENVNIAGQGVNGPTMVTLGDGNNSVILGSNALGNLASGSTVTVGNGANHVTVTGNGNTVNLGDGPNGVVLSGNNNKVVVTDPTGLGQDNVQLGAGTGDNVALDHAGGKVTGTGTGTTTVTQAGPNAVTVSLGNGTGLITLGDGKDTITANGAGTHITAGNGDDTVTANGAGDSITLGNGNNKVTAGGNNDIIKLGNGDNTVTANGNTDTFTFGDGSNTLTANGNNDKGTFASAANPGGNNTLVAKGSGDTWTFFEQPASTVKATLGSSDSLTQTGGALSATLQGDGDTVNATNVGLPGEAGGTKVNADGNNETLDWTNSGGNVNLNPSSSGDALVFNGVSNDYAGKVQITNLTGADPNVDLEDLFNTSGVHITAANFLSSLTSNGTGETLHLQGGGSIAFIATNSFDLGNFKFS